MSDLACYPYAVGHGREGVCLQMRLGPYRVLLDCGLSDLSPLMSDLTPVDLVLCSHAHPDHARGLLELHQKFPQLPVFSSEVTSQLLPLNWLDVPEIPLDLCRALPWRTPVEVEDKLTIQLWPAGHLPGAACMLITYVGPQRTYTVFYTDDFFLSNSRLVEGLPLEELRGLKPDVLIVEGSYGTARYLHRRQQENRLAEKIQRLLRSGRNILMPTPTLGLGQDLVTLLRSHHHFTGQDFTVWVDKTVAAGCDMYLELMSYFPSSVQNFARHQPLFWDERILPRVRRITNSKVSHEAPAIIIGHRSANLSIYCRNSQRPWTILLAEPYAASIANLALNTEHGGDNSPILTWLQSLTDELESGQVQLETYQLVNHCDGIGTTQLIHNLRPQHVLFVHGAPNYLADLANLEELQSRYQLHLPSVGKLVELPLGDTFVQPEAPETTFSGEIAETPEGVQVLLPEELTLDPRWRTFSDTGVIQAHWQGDDLVLQSVNQQELLKDTLLSASSIQESCQRCRHQIRQRCWNVRSPLYGFKVTPDGYCPSFEPKAELGDPPGEAFA